MPRLRPCEFIIIILCRNVIAIFDNPNLESLWDFHPNFEITGSSKIFVQLNPRLCLHNVYPLIDNILKLNRSDPGVDISETTNGNAKTCKFTSNAR